MKVSSSIASVCLLALAASCSQADRYKLTANVGEKHNDKEVILISRSNSDTIQSATVAAGTVVFEDTISAPMLVQIRVNGGPSLGQAVLEAGEITFAPETGATGTALNDIFAGMTEYQKGINERLSKISSADENAEQLQEEIFNEYETYTDSLMNANIDNPVGASLFMNKAYDLSVAEIEAALNDHPSLKGYTAIAKSSTARKSPRRPAKASPIRTSRFPTTARHRP